MIYSILHFFWSTHLSLLRERSTAAWHPVKPAEKALLWNTKESSHHPPCQPSNHNFLLKYNHIKFIKQTRDLISISHGLFSLSHKKFIKIDHLLPCQILRQHLGNPFVAEWPLSQLLWPRIHSEPWSKQKSHYIEKFVFEIISGKSSTKECLLGCNFFHIHISISWI